MTAPAGLSFSTVPHTTKGGAAVVTCGLVDAQLAVPAATADIVTTAARAVILDVRRDQEWDHSHIAGAVHIPIHQLPARLGDVPEGEVWVHCQAGYRASVAASFLDTAGRTVVAVDDGFPRAARVGLPVDGHLAPAAAS